MVGSQHGRLYRIYGWLGVTTGICLSLLAMHHVAHLHLPHARATTTLLGGIALSAGIVCAGCISLLHGKRLQHLEQKRRAALQHSQGPVILAPHQPTAITTDFAEVIVIDQKPYWRKIFVIWLLVVMTFLFMACAETLFQGSSVRDATVYPLVAVILLGPLCFLVLANGARQRLEVSEEGLTLRGGLEQKWQTLRWSEATLFAIAPTGTIGGMSTTCYELSSRTSRLRWTRLHRPRGILPLTLASATRPVSSFEEYAHQSDALVRVILTKTHLPLVDLRS